MKNKKILVVALIVCLALVVTLLPFASACGSGGEDKVLKVGMMTPSTGVAAEKGAPGGHGLLDSIDYINTELGGVNGYKIEVLWRDSGYDAAKIVTIVKNFMDEGCLMFTTHASKEMTDAMEIANRAGFPGMSCYTSPVLYHPPQHIYGQMPDYGDDWGAFATYYMENIWQGSGKPKMAMHLLNNSTGYGARDAGRALADDMGIEIVAVEEHAATTISEMESLTRIKALKPDILYISSTPAPTAIIMKNAYELGMYPGITVGCGHASFTKELIDIAGADIVEDVYGVFPTANWGDDVPGMAKLVEYCEKLHPNDAENLDYATCWATSLIVAEILRLAVENAGYDVLAKGDEESWQALETQGIQKLSNFDVGRLHGPVSYTPGDNRLSKSVRVFQIQNGKIIPITDFIEAPLVKYEDYEWFGK